VPSLSHREREKTPKAAKGEGRRDTDAAEATGSPIPPPMLVAHQTNPLQILQKLTRPAIHSAKPLSRPSTNRLCLIVARIETME